MCVCVCVDWDIYNVTLVKLLLKVLDTETLIVDERETGGESKYLIWKERKRMWLLQVVATTFFLFFIYSQRENIFGGEFFEKSKGRKK